MAGFSRFVESGAITHISYNPDTRDLKVRFRYNPDKSYVYPNVPLDVAADFVKADSVGRFFNRHVKDVYSVNRMP